MLNKHFTIPLVLTLALALSACSPAAFTTVPSSAAVQPDTPALPAPQESTSQSAQVQTEPSRLIQVTGAGTSTIQPDIARVNIGVRTEDSDVSKAIETNNATSSQVKKVMLNLGVKESDVQTSNFSVYANTRYDTTGNPLEGTNYSVENSLMVTIRDVELLGKLLGEVTKAGANNIYGITFDVADRSQAIQDARNLALKNAEKQAQETAQALGVTLGEVQNAEVIAESYLPPYIGGMGGGAEMAAAPNVPISAGQLVITVNVRMAYKIK